MTHCSPAQFFAVVTVLAAGAACDAKPGKGTAPEASGSVSEPACVRRPLFTELIGSRAGKGRVSKKSFNLPLRARGPFVLVVEYRVSAPGSVLVELDGERILRGEGYVPVAGSRGEERRLERELTLSIWEQHEIVTSITHLEAGHADVQITGCIADE